MRLLFLCIYNKDEAYDAMREAQLSYLRYLKAHRPVLMEEVRFYFIMSVSIISDIEVDEDEHMLFIPGEETRIPGILDKTIAAIRFMMGRFDYVVRTNISSCIDIPKVWQMLNDIIPQHPCVYIGGSFLELSWRDHLNGIIDARHDGTRFATGTFIGMSEALCRFIIDCPMDKTVIDDVAIGKCVRSIGQPIHEICVPSVIGSVGFQPGVFAFCNNTNKHDRSLDVFRFKKIIAGMLSEHHQEDSLRTDG